MSQQVTTSPRPSLQRKGINQINTQYFLKGSVGHLFLKRKLRREMPFPESLLWSKLRSKQLGVVFRRQHGIGDYIVDFY
ncbi:MAG: hypothetical protein UV59_C0032G0002 [Candidatus Gottesmanbacteria bacterium GW2011_GWA1_43_11]|uniref:DUF559 domain-containing protein n=1 Tax=Candidatus Gottesmanbacteria bacterium GW2011_GWA1_43_11 TaxID=1618436 RepID=A0A0G1CEE4_9BACT|nr:MAG: hypothetical protein UV59_C0032G0002 [Candidatus Gottesmanbacteria bacterium GW2011_GWA1_43_11]